MSVPTKVLSRASKRPGPQPPAHLLATVAVANEKPRPLDLVDIHIPEYQRPFASSQSKILKNYKRGLAGVLIVGDPSSWNPEPHLVVIDGLQRLTVMKALGYTKAYCVVIETESLEHEVDLFMEANETRSSVSTTDRHVAKVIAGVQPNLDIEKAAQRAGVTFDRREAKRLPLLDSIGQVQAVFKWAESRGVSQAALVKGLEMGLRSARLAWRSGVTSVRRQRGAGKWITGNAVACLVLLCTAYEGFMTEDELTEALVKIDLNTVEKNFAAEHPHLIRQRNRRTWKLWLNYFVHFPNVELGKGRKGSPMRDLLGKDVDDWVENLAAGKVL